MKASFSKNIIFATLLVICMMLTMLPLTAWADDTHTVWVKDTGAPGMANTVTVEATTLTPVAGASNDIIFTVQNLSGDTDTAFTGPHEVTLSGAQVMADGIDCGLFNSCSIPDDGTLTAEVVFSDGVATNSLSLFKAAAQTISFSVAEVTNPYFSVNLTVVPHTPAVMTLTQDITAPAINGGQFAQQPKLKLTDSYGNLCTNDSTTQVTASKKDAGDWTLTGTVTVTAVNGIITFTDLGATNAAQVAGAQLTFNTNISVNTCTSTAVTLPAPTVSDDICKIGEVGYTTLEAALDAVQNNETVTLLQSINHSQPIVIDDETITFDLGSFNLNIDTSATAGSTGLTARNGGKVICSGSGKLNVEGSKEGIRAQDGSEIHVSGSVTAGQYGVYTVSAGSGNPKVTVDGDVTVTGQGLSGEVEAVSAGGYATVTIGGHVTANRTTYTQIVTAVYSNGSTITVGKDVTTQGSGVNVQNGGKVTINGVLDFNPTGTGSQSYIKLGYPVVIKTVSDFEATSTKPDYKEYKNGDNIVWVKGGVQLGKPTGLAWDTSVKQLKATWNAVPHAAQYKVEYYKDGSKLGMSTNVNSPNISTDDIKENLLVFGMGSYTFTVQAMAAMGSSYIDSDVSAQSQPYPHGQTTYTVTVNGSYASPTGAGSYAAGSTVNIYAGNRSRYTFTGWTSSDVTITNADNKDASLTMPGKDVIVTANWSYKGGGGSSASPRRPTSTYYAHVKEGTGSETTLPVTVNKNNGTVSIDTSSGILSSGETVVTMPSIPGVDTYSVEIPVPDLSTSDAQGTLTLHTDNSIVTVPSNMLTGAPGISGIKAQISIGKGDKTTLQEDVKAAIGNRPLVQPMLYIDGKQTNWFNPGAPVTLSIPYTPTATELANTESIVIWYIDGGGNVISIRNGRYDPATGTVTFTATHFSYYAVAYNKVSFKDVAAGAWFHKAVSFIAARGITSGTGGGNFSPDAKLTRGQFIVMLMNAYDIAPDADPKDNFSDAGNTYYTCYLAAAKRLVISNGVGSNMFAPEKKITRQEMFTLLYNALKVIGQLPQGDSGKSLSDFSDTGMMDSWAKDAMTFLVKTGTVGGSNGKLTPTGTTTRAEMAQVLYNLLGK